MKGVCVFILMLLNSLCVLAQINTVDVDSIYNNANKLYQSKQYVQALEQAEIGLGLSPNYLDFRILKVNSHHKLQDAKSADSDLRTLLSNDTTNLLKPQIGNHISLIDNVEGLKAFESFLDTKQFSSNFDLKFALAYMRLDDAANTSRLVKSIDSGNLDKDEDYEYKQLLKLLNSNKISLSLEVNTFSGDYPNKKSWQIYGLGYSKRFKNLTTSLLVSNHNRFENEGFLYEVEAYPIFSKSLYAYVNFNVSDADFLHDYGISTSVFYNVKSFAEVEVGVVYLKFDDFNVTSPVIGITKYVSDYYINGRVFLGFNSNKETFQNYQINVRRYLANPEDYIFIRIGTGVAPDDNNRFSQVVNNPDLISKYVNVGLNKWFNNFNLNTSVGYLSQDLTNNLNGNQFIISAQLGYRF